MAPTVASVRARALDGSVRVSDLLRETAFVAARLGTRDVERWARHELEGYPQGAEYPPYRTVTGRPMALNPYHGWQPIMFHNPDHFDQLKERVLSNPVPDIEDQLDVQQGVILYPEDIANQMREATGYDLQMGLMVERGQNVRILEAIRGAIVDKLDGLSDLMEADQVLAAAAPPGASASGSASDGPHSAASQAAPGHQVIFNGSISNSAIQVSSPGASQTVTVDVSDHALIARFMEVVEESMNKLELPTAAVTELRADVETVKAQLASPKPKESIVRTVVTAIRDTIVGAAGNIAAAAIMGRFPTIFPG